MKQRKQQDRNNVKIPSTMLALLVVWQSSLFIYRTINVVWLSQMSMPINGRFAWFRLYWNCRILDAQERTPSEIRHRVWSLYKITPRRWWNTLPPTGEEEKSKSRSKGYFRCIVARIGYMIHCSSKTGLGTDFQGKGLVGFEGKWDSQSIKVMEEYVICSHWALQMISQPPWRSSKYCSTATMCYLMEVPKAVEERLVYPGGDN